MKRKNANIELSRKPFPSNLIPNPDSKSCECGNQYCSKESVLQRYLITSEDVHIHDIFPVDDSSNTICRVFFLDTMRDGDEKPPCDCRLPYTGEDDHLLPVSTSGHKYISLRKTFHVVSNRLLFDFLLLEMTDGCSESGYIKAFNRKRRMFVGGKECSKKVWLGAVEDLRML